MKILMAGTETALDRFEPFFISAGAETLRVSDPGRIGGVSGKPGAFTGRMDGDVFQAEAIVVLEDSRVDPLLADESAFRERLSRLPFDEPLAMVMDGGEQSPSSLSALVLNRAVLAVRRKREVVVFARDIRTADPGVELLYREARQAGVGFVKYGAISIERIGEKSLVRAFGADPAVEGGFSGEGEIASVRTSWVLDGSRKAAGGLEGFARAFRLRERTGTDTMGRFWLYPSFTSRRGVSFVDLSSLAEGRLDAVAVAIVRAASAAKTGAAPGSSAAFQARSTGYADVDAGKCAFCYTCYRACPHAALVPDEEAAAMSVIAEACEACWICAAICPANAISMKGAWRAGAACGTNDAGGGAAASAVTPVIDDRAASAALPAPGGEAAASMKAGAESGALKILACENSSYHAALAILDGAPEASGIGLESVPCCGSVNGTMIARELQRFDAVLVAACVEDACRHFDGNVKGCAHAKRLAENMERLGLPGRVRFCRASASMTGELRREILAMRDMSTAPEPDESDRGRPNGADAPGGKLNPYGKEAAP